MKKNIEFDRAMYSSDAAFQACMTYIDRFYFLLDVKKDKLVVEIEPKKSITETAFIKFLNEFKNEMLIQMARIRIANANRKVREEIVNQALYSAVPLTQQQKMNATTCQEPAGASSYENDTEEDRLIDEELERIIREADAADFKADPLDIRLPWEEKYGNASNKKAVKTGKSRGKTK